jgi:hypothetical protein
MEELRISWLILLKMELPRFYKERGSSIEKRERILKPVLHK